MDIGLLLLVRALLGVELEAPVLAVAHLDPVSGARHCLSHGQRLATQALILSCYIQIRKFCKIEPFKCLTIRKSLNVILGEQGKQCNCQALVPVP